MSLEIQPGLKNSQALPRTGNRVKVSETLAWDMLPKTSLIQKWVWPEELRAVRIKFVK